MFTRKQYLSKEVTHREYYSQFVTPKIKSLVAAKIGLKRIKKSRCPFFSDIPLKEWSTIIVPYDSFSKVKLKGTLIYDISVKMQEAGDYITIAGLVCITKEAAKQLKEELK